MRTLLGEENPELHAILDVALKPLRRKRSAESIAVLFREHGIKGKQGDTCECPTAVYLKQLTKRDNIHVGLDLAWFEPASDEIKADGFAAIALPSHVTTFIIRFDEGHYPDLELTEESA